MDDVVLGPTGFNFFTVIGRQLNGVSAGSSYGDDVESDENYPIVSLTAKDGSVFYATTSNWSNTDVANKGAQTVDFTLPEGMPADRYRLHVSGGGIRSKPFCVSFRPKHLRHLVRGRIRLMPKEAEIDDGNDDLNVANN